MSPPPILTIVIPTRERPDRLPKAVESALACTSHISTEVIVVPNGLDVSWQTAISKHLDHSALRVLPVDAGHANVARNHGMRQARGKYLRFLDDDDVLYAEGVAKQIATLEEHNLDVCSATIDLADGMGRRIGEWRQDATTDDFAAAACSHRRALQMTAHVFRRDAVCDVPWDECLPYSQDICWVLDIVSRHELRWRKVDEKSGCWYRHVDARISTNASTNRRRQFIAERLRMVAIRWANNGRLTAERRQAVADGIWEQIHDAFYLAPAYWWRMGRWAEAFFPGSHPPIRLYASSLSKKLPLDPLVWEALTFPRRMAKHAAKNLSYKLGISRWW